MRTLVLGGALALLGLLAFLTVSVAIRDGVTIVIVLSVAIILVLGVGVLGAIGSAGDDE
jgi:hypothetical protein